MISIHLRRAGAKKDPHYRVVVTDSRAARDGAFIEVLGHYHPRFEPAKVILDVQKTKAWIDKGAQPSDTVKSLLKKVDAGQVDVEQALSPSRQRDAGRHAEMRAAAPVAPVESAPEIDEAAPETDEAVAESDAGAVEPAAEEGAQEGAVEAGAAEGEDKE